jgi:hypothetical protein
VFLHVIDDFNLSLSSLIFKSLAEAQRLGYKKISMPLMHNTGMGLDGEAILNTVFEMNAGFARFRDKHPSSDLEVQIVVYNNINLKQLLSRMIL